MAEFRTEAATLAKGYDPSRQKGKRMNGKAHMSVTGVLMVLVLAGFGYTYNTSARIDTHHESLRSQVELRVVEAITAVEKRTNDRLERMEQRIQKAIDHLQETIDRNRRSDTNLRDSGRQP